MRTSFCMCSSAAELHIHAPRLLQSVKRKGKQRTKGRSHNCRYWDYDNEEKYTYSLT